MKSYKLLLLTIIISFMTGQSVSKTGTTAAQLLKLGIGSRALYICGEFTAIANFESL